MEDSIFAEFVGQEIKVIFKDGTTFKIARGRLDEIRNGFIKVVGKLGTIIIKEDNIEKMGRLKSGE